MHISSLQETASAIASEKKKPKDDNNPSATDTSALNDHSI
jgi:hypothetical protein